jgi:hypothetical protein
MFETKIFYIFHISPTCATCRVHLVLIRLSIPIILCQQHILRSSSNCHLLSGTVPPSSLQRASSEFCVLRHLSLCLSVREGEPVSRSYKTAGETQFWRHVFWDVWSCNSSSALLPACVMLVSCFAYSSTLRWRHGPPKRRFIPSDYVALYPKRQKFS